MEFIANDFPTPRLGPDGFLLSPYASGRPSLLFLDFVWSPKFYPLSHTLGFKRSLRRRRGPSMQCNVLSEFFLSFFLPCAFRSFLSVDEIDFIVFPPSYYFYPKYRIGQRYGVLRINSCIHQTPWPSPAADFSPGPAKIKF